MGIGWVRSRWTGVVLTAVAAVAAACGAAGDEEDSAEGETGMEQGEMAFVSPLDTNGPFTGHLLVTDLQGEVRQLTDSSATDHGPTWSPDGRRLAFTSDRDSAGDIFVLHPDGELDNLTASDRRETDPAWSPDGQHIAFVRHDDASRARDVWIMDADGSGARNLTEQPDVIDTHPAWSPDGQQLAFMSTRDERVHLWVLDLDTGDVDNLSEGLHPREEDIHALPAWSPDGDQIAFIRWRQGERSSVWLMDATGQDVQPLTDEHSYETGPLAWSPDGSWLAVSSTRLGEDAGSGGRITDQAPEDFEPTSEFLWHQYELSIDRFAFMDGVALLPVDGGAPERPADLDVRASAPAWRAEGPAGVPEAADEVDDTTEPTGRRLPRPGRPADD
jgi:dipeptidyl aminopeptidase/acylaminoacyl peptidase